MEKVSKGLKKIERMLMMKKEKEEDELIKSQKVIKNVVSDLMIHML